MILKNLRVSFIEIFFLIVLIKLPYLKDKKTASDGLTDCSIKNLCNVSKHLGKNKLSSAPYKNCERKPLFELEDHLLILDIIALMELHLFTGNYNRQFRCLNDALEAAGFPRVAMEWAKSRGRCTAVTLMGIVVVSCSTTFQN